MKSIAFPSRIIDHPLDKFHVGIVIEVNGKKIVIEVQWGRMRGHIVRASFDVGGAGYPEYL
jgi:hypothetical protein